jgi:beta-lactam-binding protein with PASTA domain
MPNNGNPQKGKSSITGKITGFYQKHPVFSHFILIVITGVFLALLALLFLDIWTAHGKTTTIPEIKGLSYVRGAAVLNEAGMSIEISDSIYDTSAAPGQIMETMPRAHTTVKPGRTVYVTVNAFSPRKVTVNAPLTDVSSRQAIAYLKGLGLTNIRKEYVTGPFDDLVKAVIINGQHVKTGASYPITSQVTVQITKGTEASYDIETGITPETQAEIDEAVNDAFTD